MSTFLTKLDYLLRETLLGIKRGGWMNWAAISTVAVLLFLFGASLQTSWQLENVLGQLGSQLEISVYLEQNVAGITMQPQIEGIAGVATVQIIDKEQAWQKLLKDLGDIDPKNATAQLGVNPLVDELKVRAINSDRLPELAKQIQKIAGVNEVWYTNEVVDRLRQLRQAVTSTSSVVVVVFTLVAIAVIMTTIRLIVMARRLEIEIMQLVGATANWIYFPFILQGVFFGIIGAAIAYTMLVLGLNLLSGIIVNQPELIKSLSMGLTNDPRVEYFLPVILLGFGSAIGVLGSLIAVRRFSLNQT
ncbi:cell division protein [Synechococcus sp. PCC 7502]|uniref:cell division protein FtsX n=1 Tax=Synechococcus sp. PCC 7502 TaxID=1173263 RepID=UPI00029FA655|nr:ABC transporter permease [Synechococcus sp. PCC 7502]AFY73135.1 cell division protein [Synechococcus sp. PCC 7502]